MHCEDGLIAWRPRRYGKGKQPYLCLPAAAAIAAAVDAMSVWRSAIRWRQRSRRGGGEVGHIQPTTTAIAQPNGMALAAIQGSHSADLQQFVEKTWSVVSAGVGSRGKGPPFLVGDLLARWSFGAHPKASLQHLPGRLIRLQSKRGIALRRQQIMLHLFDSCRDSNIS